MWRRFNQFRTARTHTALGVNTPPPSVASLPASCLPSRTMHPGDWLHGATPMQDATYRDRTAVTLPDALPRLPLTPAGIQEEIAFVHELQDACGYDLPHSRYPQPGTEVIDRLLRPEDGATSSSVFAPRSRYSLMLPNPHLMRTSAEGRNLSTPESCRSFACAGDAASVAWDTRAPAHAAPEQYHQWRNQALAQLANDEALRREREEWRVQRHGPLATSRGLRKSESRQSHRQSWTGRLRNSVLSSKRWSQGSSLPPTAVSESSFPTSPSLQSDTHTSARSIEPASPKETAPVAATAVDTRQKPLPSTPEPVEVHNGYPTPVVPPTPALIVHPISQPNIQLDAGELPSRFPISTRNRKTASFHLPSGAQDLRGQCGVMTYR